MEEDNSLKIEQNVGNVDGDFTKSITINEDDGLDSGEMWDVEAVIELTYNVFAYIPEIIFVSLYGLLMYAAVLYISKKIKG